MGEEKNTEQTILEAAEKLFLDKGFALTSTVEIAKEAGCNQAMVHYYFRTKEKLFNIIFENKIQELMQAVYGNDDLSLPFTERLKRMIEAHYEVLARNPKFPIIFFNELSTNPERFREMVQKMSQLPKTLIERFSDDLNKEISEGRIRKITPLDLLQTVVSLNITPFLINPLFREITGLNNVEFQKLMSKRKQENVLIIMRSLMP
ncbi:MAG: TetR/AcrR family transcriptional regulator [Prolixibacteraceae bacterium]|nr:TetR/AcrR family transcriptional regulator [Prolixibacteraceae bacterium]